MTQDGGTPPDFWTRVQQMIDRGVAAAMRSGPLRNASISDGGLSITGGFLRLVYETFNMLYVGPVTPSAGDGTPQQAIRLRRADGTMALQIHDAFPGADGNSFNQALTLFDRSGNAIFADDTDSGQGIGRPYLPFVAYRSDSNDWPLTTSTTFVTKHWAHGPKQQPKLFVEAWMGATDPAAIAEVQVMVNGVVWGAAQSGTAGAVTGHLFGPATVSGTHLQTLEIEVQYRLASGVGSVKCGVARIEGRQT